MKDHNPSLVKTVIGFIMVFISQIAIADMDSKLLFEKGYHHYDKERYAEAIPLLEQAVQIEPKNAQYQHILAKAYGREAEDSNWFKAMDLAKKTLAHLEIAAKLDPNNLEILDDLMEFYREAPSFLGGDDDKADEIELKIKQLSQN